MAMDPDLAQVAASLKASMAVSVSTAASSAEEGAAAVADLRQFRRLTHQH